MPASPDTEQLLARGPAGALFAFQAVSKHALDTPGRAGRASPLTAGSLPSSYPKQTPTNTALLPERPETPPWSVGGNRGRPRGSRVALFRAVVL